MEAGDIVTAARGHVLNMPDFGLILGTDHSDPSALLGVILAD